MKRTEVQRGTSARWRRVAMAVASLLVPAIAAAQEPPLPAWDAVVGSSTDLVRPQGRFIWAHLGYGPCASTLQLPDSVTLVGKSAGAADSIGAVAKIDAENAEQWYGVALPRRADWQQPVRVVGARCRDRRVTQLIVQQGSAYAVVFAEHPAALGVDGFLRAKPSAGLAPLSWRTTAAGTTVAR
jgi:hypothetical protein